MILNDTRVIQGEAFFQKSTGGVIEIILPGTHMNNRLNSIIK